MTPERRDEPGLGTVEVFPLDAGQASAAVRDCVGRWWSRVALGVRSPAATVSARLGGPAAAERLGDRLLLRLAPPGGTVLVDLAEPAALVRVVHGGRPLQWGLRVGPLWLTFDHPLLEPDGTPRPAPDWTALEPWDALRAEHLGLAPDPADRLPAPPADREGARGPAGAGPTCTVLACRGCCCSSLDQEGERDGQLDALRAAVAAAPGARLRVTNCLGPCERKNVVAVRHRDAGRPGQRLGTTWLWDVSSPEATAALAGWVRDGAPKDAVPDGLATFDAREVDVTPDAEVTLAGAKG